MSLSLNFSGKKILVTGGTRGIGKKIATQFLMNGGDVTITGTKFIDESKLKKDWGFEKYQQVVNQFPNACWLQVGISNDKLLNNVIDLRSKTP